jgi:hypothetical protein
LHLLKVFLSVRNLEPADMLMTRVKVRVGVLAREAERLVNEHEDTEANYEPGVER